MYAYYQRIQKSKANNYLSHMTLSKKIVGYVTEVRRPVKSTNTGAEVTRLDQQEKTV